MKCFIHRLAEVCDKASFIIRVLFLQSSVNLCVFYTTQHLTVIPFSNQALIILANKFVHLYILLTKVVRKPERIMLMTIDVFRSRDTRAL
jgi:hypothetical protein